MTSFIRAKKIPTNIIAALLLVVIVLVGFAMTRGVYRQAVLSENRSLVERSRTIAAALDPTLVEQLHGNSADVSTPALAALRTSMQSMRGANSDVRFVYLTGRRGEQIFFFADAEDEKSPDYSPPGQVYTEASPLLYSLFDTGTPSVEGPYTDRWGEWITGFSPVYKPGTNEVAALLGVDISAQTYHERIRAYTLVPSLSLVMLVLLLCGALVMWKRKQENLELRARFLSLASHELRAPISGLSWASTSLLGDRKHPLGVEQRRTISLMKQSIQSLLSTVNNVLSMARSERGISRGLKREPVDFTLLVKDVVSSLEFAAAEKSVALEVEGGWPAGLLLSVDREQMVRAVTNFITNAIKYSKPQGAVITLRYLAEPGVVRFSISDNGIGIPVGEQPNVFHSYFRASNASSATAVGTGLGLFFSKEIIELHGGRVWFKSREGKGTTFFVELPKGEVNSK